MKLARPLVVLLVYVSIACSAPGLPAVDVEQPLVWSLYRSSMTNAAMRIHIATFDADDDGSLAENGLTYNGANCDLARNLFQAQDGVRVKFWCEQGRARK